MRPKVSQTIIAESALNDPIGAVLALTLAGDRRSRATLRSPSRSLDFVKELAISLGLGVGFGVAALARRLEPAASGSGGSPPASRCSSRRRPATSRVDSAGGSGYLGAFLAGLIVGNMDMLRLGMHAEHERATAHGRRRTSPT